MMEWSMDKPAIEWKCENEMEEKLSNREMAGQNGVMSIVIFSLFHAILH